MKKSIFNKLILVLVFFATVDCLSFSNQKVEAAVWFNKPRRVVVTNKVKAYQYFSAAPLYQAKKIKTVTLQPGQSIKIRQVLDFGTLLTGGGFKYTATKRYSRFWVVPNYKDWWFDTYSKYEWLDKGLLTNSTKEAHIIYRFNWKQYKQLMKLGVLSYDYTKKDWLTKVKPLVNSWHVKTERD